MTGMQIFLFFIKMQSFLLGPPLIAVQQIELKGAQRSLLLSILDDLWDSCSLKHEKKCTALYVEHHILFLETWIVNISKRKIRSHQLKIASFPKSPKNNTP